MAGGDRPGCRGTRRDGSPCLAPPHAVNADGWCWAHDPTKRAERTAVRAKGGKHSSAAARAEKLMPAHMRPIFGAVVAAIRDVRDGTLSPQRGAAIASLAGAAVRVYQAGLLEDRLRELEAAYETLGRRA